MVEMGIWTRPAGSKDGGELESGCLCDADDICAAWLSCCLVWDSGGLHEPSSVAEFEVCAASDSAGNLRGQQICSVSIADAQPVVVSAEGEFLY